MVNERHPCGCSGPCCLFRQDYSNGLILKTAFSGALTSPDEACSPQSSGQTRANTQECKCDNSLNIMQIYQERLSAFIRTYPRLRNVLCWTWISTQRNSPFSKPNAVMCHEREKKFSDLFWLERVQMYETSWHGAAGRAHVGLMTLTTAFSVQFGPVPGPLHLNVIVNVIRPTWTFTARHVSQCFPLQMSING